MAWAPDYVTTEAMRNYLRIADTDDDVQIAMAISAASRAVDQYAGRQFGQVDAAEDRMFTARWDRRRCRWVIEIDDVMDDSGLEVWTDAGEIDVFALEPANAPQRSRPWTRIVVDPSSAVMPTSEENGVSVTETMWGWLAYPAAVEQATALQASRFLARRDSPFGVAGSPDSGTELRLLARVDPDVGVALNPYRRVWGSA